MKKKAKRGFAAMSPEQRRRIASMGGKAAARGNGHKWTREEAVAAGRKGGLASQGGVTRFDSESGANAARQRKRKKR